MAPNPTVTARVKISQNTCTCQGVSSALVVLVHLQVKMSQQFLTGTRSIVLYC